MGIVISNLIAGIIMFCVKMILVYIVVLLPVILVINHCYTGNDKDTMTKAELLYAAAITGLIAIYLL